MLNVWYHAIDNGARLGSGVSDMLTRRGLGMYRLDGRPPGGMGIVCFNLYSDSVCSFVRDVSAKGASRILAIAASESPLTSGEAWQVLHAGASDVVTLADDVEGLADKIAAQFERWQSVDQLLEEPRVRDRVAGRSPAWRSVLRQVVDVARFTDASVMVTGESGTGKELIAHLIHDLDQRQQKKDLVILDCTTIVPELSGSEFFGHERGAFTGAVVSRDGAFALAKGGTLFLDEVGELPLKLQTQLLRVVQERTYKRVGGNAWNETDFRLVCATNKNLKEAVARGEFRSDLYYRIAHWTCRLPPLRDRGDDILLLTRQFMQDHLSAAGAPEIDPQVREMLLKREYPGNVRDLKQLVARIMCRYAGHGPITVGDVPDEERPQACAVVHHWSNGQLEAAIRQALMFNAGLKEIRRATENIAIDLAINEAGGNLQRAAKKLRVTDRALQIRRAADRQQKQNTHYRNDTTVSS